MEKLMLLLPTKIQPKKKCFNCGHLAKDCYKANPCEICDGTNHTPEHCYLKDRGNKTKQNIKGKEKVANSSYDEEEGVHMMKKKEPHTFV